MFKSKQEIAEDIKSKVAGRINYPNLDLSNQSLNALGYTIENAIFDCVRDAILVAVEEIVDADIYTEEDFEKDIGIR
jgi:hypothetical protein